MSIECSSTIVFPDPNAPGEEGPAHPHTCRPIAFKVKTLPLSSTVYAQTAVESKPMEQLLFRALDTEPEPGAKCRDKFLVQSTELKPEHAGLEPTEIWPQVDKNDIHEKKIRCAYGDAAGAASAAATSAPASEHTTERAAPATGEPAPAPATVAAKVPAPATSTARRSGSSERVAAAPAAAPMTSSTTSTTAVYTDQRFAVPHSPGSATPQRMPTLSSRRPGFATVGRPKDGAVVIPQVANTVTVKTAFLMSVICFLVGLLI
ncbi:MSP domain-containing protein [Schizosaccharomyces japonicus yFS275]|uniref:MSP domain-containing protein n=1 Tax=Schizosaccharomyces japonicus (strain yFS275 / FY16936) TaxID=402676 RepID=B6JUT0_SCHJY|nr:MSP domain-containing protein [Schizosaccharomyces japonicus yFS275]EEB05061.2 MSP domain-containing protein [Schizosaccharomyces japonicus yFS275]